MKRQYVTEVLPELLSEFVFIGLLIVGVMLFFVWVTRARPQLQRVAARARSEQLLEPAEPVPAEARLVPEGGLRPRPGRLERAADGAADASPRILVAQLGPDLALSWTAPGGPLDRVHHWYTMNTMARLKPKEKHVSVRVSGGDLELLERAAAAVHLSVATYVRQQALVAARRDDPRERSRRAAEALSALREGISPAQATALRAAHRRSE